MGYPVREYVKNFWYHICTRGQRGEPLFFSFTDRIKYLSLLDAELSRRGGNIGSFCLMTTHLHLLLRMAAVPLGEILQVAHSQYGKFFNARHGTEGHVLQKPPKVKIVLSDAYLWGLVGYLHRNPLEAGMVNQVTDYRWSSWYWFEGQECDWITLKSWLYPPGFEGPAGRQRFREAVDRGDHYWPDGRSYIGTEAQWDQLTKRRQPGREAQAYKERRGLQELKDIAGSMVVGTGYTIEQIQGPSRNKKICFIRHKIMAEMYTEGHKQADIARFFNRTPRAVRKAIKKFSGL